MAIAQRCLYSMSSGARTHWTLPAVIVLWTSLWGIASSYPIPSRTNATFLEKKWETLFSRSYLGINGGKSELNWESDYLQGIKRVRRLYCNVGIGFHLQVLPDGRISGAHNENQYSLIEISTVDRGVISLFGVRSELFVAMNSRGRLYGTLTEFFESAYLTLLYEWSGKKQEVGICIRKGHFFCNNMPPPPISLKACFVGRLSAKVKRVFVDECKFKETLLPNNYNAYESFVYKGFYIALSKHGRVKRGNKATTAMTVTHFLPRL